MLFRSRSLIRYLSVLLFVDRLPAYLDCRPVQKVYHNVVQIPTLLGRGKGEAFLIHVQQKSGREGRLRNACCVAGEGMMARYPAVARMCRFLRRRTVRPQPTLWERWPSAARSDEVVPLHYAEPAVSSAFLCGWAVQGYRFPLRLGELFRESGGFTKGAWGFAPAGAGPPAARG